MEKTIYQQTLSDIENQIRNLKLKPLPDDIYLCGELVNLWLNTYKISKYFSSKFTDNGKEENE